MTTSAYNRRYYLEHKEAIKAQVVAYRKNHPDLVKKWSKINKDRHKEHNREWSRNYYKSTMEDFRRRQLIRYNITPEQYDELLAKQNGVCAICNNPCSSGKRLAVDHCHKTNKVRGLLCYSCNVHLGWLEKKTTEVEKYLAA